jgi:hypothetical protein
VPNWKIASGLDTHLPSPQTEQPPGGVAGHAFVAVVGFGVVGFGVVGCGVLVIGFDVVGSGVMGADVVGTGVLGTPTALQSHIPIRVGKTEQYWTISCLPA